MARKATDSATCTCVVLACLLLCAAGVTIEQIKADADKSAAAAQAVLSQEAEPGRLSNQWKASDTMQADKN
jgi:TRAP-type C4-dicarboxylate transport system permease small subunit